MNEHDPSIGEDGLTDHEREFLQTPVGQLSREDWQNLIAIRDKKNAFIWADNERQRKAEIAAKETY